MIRILLGRATAIAALAFTWVCACAELPRIDKNVCGNGVVEGDEQCDMRENPDLGPETRCADPSDSVRACHYVCSESSKCPTAWGCGDDGICQFADGAFRESESSPISMPAFAKLSLEDMDGDTRRDLVTSAPAGISVRYAKSDGSFSSGFDFPLQQYPRFIGFGDLNNDERTDIIASTPRGPIELIGQRDRTLEATIFAQISAPEDLNDRVKGSPISVKLNGARTGSDLCGEDGFQVVITIAYESELDLAFPMAQLGRVVPEYMGVASVPSRVYTRDLDGDKKDELIVALPGSNKIRIYHLGCEERMGPGPGGMRGQLTISDSVIDLPGPMLMGSIDSVSYPDAIFFTDLNEDGRLDLIVALDPGFTGQWSVAIMMATLDGYAPAELHNVPEQPIAAADLDSDGIADFVVPSGIVYGNGAPLIEARRLNYWSEAAIEDFDGDGLLDVAAVSASLDVSGIELYSSRPYGMGAQFAGQSPSTLIDTRGHPRGLRAQDFDGDGILDLAFIEANIFGIGSLSVLYGGVFERVQMGTPGYVISFETTEMTGDRAADVMIIALRDSAVQIEANVGLLFGSDERRLLSPVPIYDVTGDTDEDRFKFDPPRVVLGKFLGEDDNVDILAFNHSWFILSRGHGDGQFETSGSGDARTFALTDIVPQFSYLGIECVHFIPADIDAASKDSEVVVVAEAECLSNEPVAGGPRDPGNGGLILESSEIMVVGGSDARGLPKVAALELPAAVHGITGAVITDLDGPDENGVTRPELIVMHAGSTFGGSPIAGPNGDLPGPGAGETAESGVIVYWNVHADFTAGTPAIEYEASTSMPSPMVSSLPRAAVAINADGDAQLELAVLVQDRSAIGSFRSADEGGIYIADFPSKSEFTWATFPAVDLSISTLGEPVLASTDVDGDGLGDLVYGDGLQVSMFLSLPHRGGDR